MGTEENLISVVRTEAFRNIKFNYGYGYGLILKCQSTAGEREKNSHKNKYEETGTDKIRDLKYGDGIRTRTRTPGYGRYYMAPLSRKTMFNQL